ncbi:BnaC02g23830D [Brassica napus]|uniref:BnaC02g23830D protein n=1 Tax=Brassica napus TaxID=3708 RepID=A0A078FKS4_BRANA|nr:BnaC02g23830D [Brassica napus]
MIGYVTDVIYGIPSRCPRGERVIDEVSPNPKYPTDVDTFPGSRYFTCKDFEAI